MSEVFISYSRRDTEMVDRIVRRLEQAGMDVWIDREDIMAGESWRVQIVEAIDASPAFVFMASPNSVISKNVQKEIILAHDAGHAIFLVQLEPVVIPAEIKYQLAGLQIVDISMLGFDKAVDNLIVALKKRLEKLKPAPPQKQAELVIQGVDLASFSAEKQQQLLAFLANLTGTNQSQLSIANLAAGSVHAFVNLPARAAYLLKTLALNHDPRFAEMNVVSLRLAGSAGFVNVATGEVTSPLKTPRGGFRLWMLIAAAIVIAGLGFFFMRRTPPPAPEVLPEPPAKQQAQVETPSATPTDTPAPTLTPTATFTATPTDTPAPTFTPSPSATPVPRILAGVTLERLNCRYGPGADYLYKYGFAPKLELQVLGREETGSWLYVQGLYYPQPCWLNAKLISMEGDVSQLEVVYPGKYTLPGSRWPPLKNVTAKWLRPNRLEISWTEFLLPLGERESAESPLYLAELWLCKDGQLTFTPVGVWGPYLEVDDEPGCAEPSRGWMYLAEKHGYAGPVEIVWPPRENP